MLSILESFGSFYNDDYNIILERRNVALIDNLWQMFFINKAILVEKQKTK